MPALKPTTCPPTVYVGVGKAADDPPPQPINGSASQAVKQVSKERRTELALYLK